MVAPIHSQSSHLERGPSPLNLCMPLTNGTCLTYDALGRMVEKSVNSTYTEVLYSPVGKTAIMSGQTTTNAYFPLPAGETLYETGSTGSTQYFWHTDWLGSVRFASTIGNRTSYFDRAFGPFGETYSNFGSTSGNNFTGDTQDTISGTYDTPNRELNPNQGRWLSPDPAGSGAVDPTNPQTWNRYAYVGDNPLSRIDPTGMVDINPGMMYAMMGGGGGMDCNIDGLSAPCSVAYSLLQGGGAVQCPNNNCGIATSTPFQCLDVACGYMSNQFVATHENEWNGILYSASEWQTFLTDRIDAQRQALADAISTNSDLTWQQAYDSLQYVQTKGGNADFKWDPSVTGLTVDQIGLDIPLLDSGGCELLCRLGTSPSIHYNNSMFHLDNVSAAWAFPLGLLGHGLIDFGIGNINGSVPFVY
jgi:RHS repeat-associated protein